MSTNSTLFAFFNTYPIFPVANLLIGTAAFVPLFCLLYIAQITPLHSNCRYILCMWALSFGSVFVVTILVAIVDLKNESGYMPLSEFTNDCRHNLYQLHVMSTTFCALFEIALSIERFAAIVKPRRYHFSDFAWFILLPLTVAFMAVCFGIDACVHSELGGVYPYIGLALLALIEVSVLATGSFAMRVSQKRYDSSYGKTSLTVRYQVKEACEMSRAMIPAYATSFTLKASTIIVIYFFFTVRAVHENILGYVEAYYSLAFVINGIFSLTILLLKHSQLRKQFIRKFRSLLKIKPAHTSRDSSAKSVKFADISRSTASLNFRLAMEPKIFISLDGENIIIISHRILFVCSTLCNVVDSICLFKVTPEMQAEIKFYLYYMQVLCLLSDLLFDVVVEPFPLLPILGGYCKGLFSPWISIRMALILTILLMYNFGFCMFASIFSLHQAIVSGRNFSEEYDDIVARRKLGRVVGGGPNKGVALAICDTGTMPSSLKA